VQGKAAKTRAKSAVWQVFDSDGAPVCEAPDDPTPQDGDAPLRTSPPAGGTPPPVPSAGVPSWAPPPAGGTPPPVPPAGVPSWIRPPAGGAPPPARNWGVRGLRGLLPAIWVKEVILLLRQRRCGISGVSRSGERIPSKG